MKRASFREVFAGALVGACMGLLYLGCGSTDKLDGGGGLGGSAGASGSGGGGGLTFTLTTGQGGESDAGGVGGTSDAAVSTWDSQVVCGDTTITPSHAPVDILIVLDRSASMLYSISGNCYCAPSISGGSPGEVCQDTTGCIDRWTAVKTAVTQAMAADSSVSWGLEIYSSPSGSLCTVPGAPQVPIAADSAARVKALLASTAPGGNTPTGAAITVAASYLQGVTDPNSKAILLATDGIPNCTGGDPISIDDMPATTTAVAAAAALGFRVFVVGMGPATSIANLNQLAQAGDTTHYYSATSPQELAESLATISKIVATTCSFQTPQPPPDDAKVWVYVDKQLIGQSMDGGLDSGWTFGGTTSDIVLTGTYCSELLGGKPSTVQILFGCKDAVPPPIIP